MADTAHKTDEELREHFDAPAEVAAKVRQLAAWIRASKHFVCFTGAGISTSAGIPDFRGPNGVWTLRAQGKTAVARTSTLRAQPTLCHLALLELQRAGLLKFLISQNTDGIHRRSGFPPRRLAELHGNSNLEKCPKCRKDFLRDFRCRSASQVHAHETDRRCPQCDGPLYDSIINFGENLPEYELKEGFRQSKLADLHLCLGSSLRVTPAADMPERTADRGKRLVVVNLQATPLDAKAALVIHDRIDNVMKLLMDELGLSIPDFVLHRYIALSAAPAAPAGTTTVRVAGIDSDATPVLLLKRVALLDAGGAELDSSTSDPAVLRARAGVRPVAVRCEFFGNYGEPEHVLQLDRLLPSLAQAAESAVALDLNVTRGATQWVERARRVDASAGAGAGAGAPAPLADCLAKLSALSLAPASASASTGASTSSGSPAAASAARS